eukprot:SAG11_NODE_9116_length_941_cov_1.150831_1_plen_120_part_00
MPCRQLIRTPWRFCFKQDLDHARSNAALTACFRSDGTFVSSVPGAPSARRPLKYFLCAKPGDDAVLPAASGGRSFDEDDECKHFVQVKRYPALVVSRAACRWRMENDMVLMEELDVSTL